MFLQLNHQHLKIFKVSKELVTSPYLFTKDFPSSEKFTMVQQIRRAALSVHLNIADGCTRKSLAERKRLYEIARRSVIEIDTAFDIAIELKYSTAGQLNKFTECIL